MIWGVISLSPPPNDQFYIVITTKIVLFTVRASSAVIAASVVRSGQYGNRRGWDPSAHSFGAYPDLYVNFVKFQTLGGSINYPKSTIRFPAVVRERPIWN